MTSPLPLLTRHPVCRTCGVPMVRTGRATYCPNPHTKKAT